MTIAHMDEGRAIATFSHAGSENTIYRYLNLSLCVSVSVSLFLSLHIYIYIHNNCVHKGTSRDRVLLPRRVRCQVVGPSLPRVNPIYVYIHTYTYGLTLIPLSLHIYIYCCCVHEWRSRDCVLFPRWVRRQVVGPVVEESHRLCCVGRVTSGTIAAETVGDLWEERGNYKY